VSGQVVVDASLALAWVIQERFTSAAITLLSGWDQQATGRIAPALFASECASVLLKHTRRGTVTRAGAQRALGDLLTAVALEARDGELAGRALEIADLIGAGRAYDSLYIALAEHEGCELWTGDERLLNAAMPHFAFIRWVGMGTT
jgi:predicted nucleic acid-binding protein